MNRDIVVRVDRRTNRALLVAVPVVILLCLGILSSLNILPRLHNPFGERIIDRSQPVLLQSIQDLSRYEAASGNFQVVVDLERDAKFLPDFVRGQRTLFVGVGSVDAYVDFARIGRESVTVSGDGKKADLRLPHAQLERAALDTKNSYVFAQRQGLLNRIGAFFSSNPNSQQQVYALAQAKIEQAAQDTALTARAEQNTRTMLEGMLRSLGFREVTVQFADQP